jgi:hypothetical protein
MVGREFGSGLGGGNSPCLRPWAPTCPRSMVTKRLREEAENGQHGHLKEHFWFVRTHSSGPIKLTQRAR